MVDGLREMGATTVAGQGTKVCPQCGQVLFADMPVCYGCLCDFAREAQREGMPGLLGDGEDDAMAPRGGEALGSPVSDGLGLRVQTGDVTLTVPLPPRGLMVGRQPTCDVALHSRAVSARHLLVVPEGGSARMEDQGATNPALLRGREVTGSVTLLPGETVDVCGTLLTLVGSPQGDDMP